MSSRQRPVPISGVSIREERTLGWGSGPRSVSAPILMGKVGQGTSLLQLSVLFFFDLLKYCTGLEQGFSA